MRIALLTLVFIVSVGLTKSNGMIKKPLVILISVDGFKWGYQFKTSTPNIDFIKENGVEAFPGMIPVFPTVTMPNHNSIATDPSFPRFNVSWADPRWWHGEPLWETVVRNGLRAGTYLWPGSEVVRGHWTCPQEYCARLANSSLAFEDRIDSILKFVDMPVSKRPSFIAVYFDNPDHAGHASGPDSQELTDAVSNIDKMVGRLLDGLEARGILNDVHIIMVSDHGMVTSCESKVIYLEDLAPWIRIPDEWYDWVGAVVALRPPRGFDAKHIVKKMNEGLQSGRVNNGQFLKVFLKEDLPERLHFSHGKFGQPIIGLASESYTVKLGRSTNSSCGGFHGYDNAYSSMRSVFFAHGPRFPKRKVASFPNVEIYNIITTIIGIRGAPNNGTLSFARDILI
ncbi:ectonucleotide pyrophosphatase/phosphodiesterase family member 3 [Selaginella moellendorffii]|uniref:ectonucleotide pyrophosphatase/phosphodiesterase family member 3 n=1 Tax=Selaginella moellendorffii TaxID=88036 RepID=UPI000D1C6A11|nr:ectonucleotide pyrophosphatase/phosphodiesterase family member 3 [Selaginella moellendorffii]|eukprot:XP_024539898.1 ectonucleotide pyrophosphatase/phosphodiesterase family member 3 [Selaginella moellendorffii]